MMIFDNTTDASSTDFRPKLSSANYALTLGLCGVAILIVLMLIAAYQTYFKRCSFMSRKIGPFNGNMTYLDPYYDRRRDSDLIAVIEQDLLQRSHRKVMMPLFKTKSSKFPLVRESTINFISVDGSMRESTINYYTDDMGSVYISRSSSPLPRLSLSRSATPVRRMELALDSPPVRRLSASIPAPARASTAVNRLTVPRTSPPIQRAASAMSRLENLTVVLPPSHTLRPMLEEDA